MNNSKTITQQIIAVVLEEVNGHSKNEAIEGSKEYNGELEDRILKIINDNLTINSETICVFDNFNQWVNRATRLLGHLENEEILCLDKNGNHCYVGKQFMFARDNDLFPITAYRLIKNTDREARK